MLAFLGWNPGTSQEIFSMNELIQTFSLKRVGKAGAKFDFDKTKTQGIHIHCPEGSVPKDGPSAGTAITVALFSLFTNKKIKHDFAITGEISLQGNVTEIGGLDLKIIGGIQGGVKSFIYPEKNKKDFKEFMEKYKNKDIIKNIKFYPVNTFDEVLKLILV